MQTNSTSNAELIAGALEVAAQGFPVFPVGADKVPIISGWPENATTSPPIIRKMFSMGGAKLIGIPTGERSGIDVLDFDYRNGAAPFEDANRHRLPETKTHETPSGGRHLLFAHDPRVDSSASRFAPGVDVRGRGGMFITPPSPGYILISDVPLAPWPDWLLQPGFALPKEKPQPRPASASADARPKTDQLARRYDGYVEKLLQNVHDAAEGAKHTTLRNNARSLGGIMDHAEVNEDDAVNWLLGALPDTVLDWENARQTALDGLRHGRESPYDLEDRPRPGRAQAFGLGAKADEPAGGGEEGADHPGTEAEAEPEPEAKPEPEGAETERGRRYGRLRVFGVDDIGPTSTRSYLLKGLISPAEISVWVGAPKCGKSFLLLHVAYLLSLGRSVFGRRVKATRVLYVAAEGEAGIENRIRALRDKYGRSDNFRYIAQPADLLHVDGHKEDLILAAAAHDAQLIVLDTLSRLLAGGDENSPKDMGSFVQNVAEVRHVTQAHMVVIHHGTKGSGGTDPRGHSSLTGADDALIEVIKNQDGSRTATVVHAKDDPDGMSWSFSLDTVMLGIDEDGDPITTLIVKEADIDAATDRPQRREEAGLSPAPALLLRSLRKIDPALFETIKPERDAFQTKAVRRQTIARAAFIADGWFPEHQLSQDGGTLKATKSGLSAEHNALRSLKNKNFINFNRDWIWLV